MTDKQTPEWMQKKHKLTPAEIEEFLAGPVVRIATIDENGAPYITPTWQEWDAKLLGSSRGRSAWIAHIKKKPNFGISYAQHSGTYMRFTAQGKAEIVFAELYDIERPNGRGLRKEEIVRWMSANKSWVR